MRTPAKLPGPTPQAKPSSCAKARPASASSACTCGSNCCVWERPATAKRSTSEPSSHRATEQASVAVSIARSFTSAVRERREQLVDVRFVERQRHAGAPFEHRGGEIRLAGLELPD